MPFDQYDWSNTTNLGEAFIDAPNHYTGDAFWVTILYTIWVIALALTSAFGWEVALLMSSFGGLIIGVFMVYLGAIAFEWILPFVGVILFMFMYIMWSSKT